MAWQIAQSLVYQISKVYVDTLNFKEDAVHLTIPAFDLKMCKKRGLIEKRKAYLSLASFAFYRLNGYEHFREYFFNFVRFYVIIRLLFIEQTRKNYHKIAWIAEIATSQIVADHKGNTFIMEKIVKTCYAFYYYHCYLSITKH